jgi:hypothetical protein
MRSGEYPWCITLAAEKIKRKRLFLTVPGGWEQDLRRVEDGKTKGRSRKSEKTPEPEQIADLVRESKPAIETKRRDKLA